MHHQSSNHHHSSNHSDNGTSGGSGLPRTWELNQYELNRLPHEIHYDERLIAVSPKELQTELMCPICLDILKHTMTTKECLHRFCQECIITALRAGNKECPTCRKKLISKRSLRPDPNFDAIIAKIYPNREEYDALHEKVLEKLNKKHLTSIGGGSASNSTSGDRTGRSTSRRSTAAQINGNSENSHSSTAAATSSNGKAAKRASSVAASSSAAAAAHSQISDDDSDMESRTSTEQSSTTHGGFQQDADEIELVLKPHPLKESTLTSKRFIKTTSNATMTHLSKYLWTRLCVEGATSATSETASTATSSNTPEASNESEFQLFIHQSKNTYHQLDSNLTLDQAIEQYWKQNRPIELFYYHPATTTTTSKKQPTATTTTTAAANNSSKTQQHLTADTNSNSSASSSSSTSSSSLRSSNTSSTRK